MNGVGLVPTIVFLLGVLYLVPVVMLYRGRREISPEWMIGTG